MPEVMASEPTFDLRFEKGISRRRRLPMMAPSEKVTVRSEIRSPLVIAF